MMKLQQRPHSPSLFWLFCLFLALTTIATSAHARQPPILPPSPGVTSDLVTQDNLASTICKPGYTAAIRPNTGYTNTLKRALVTDEEDKVLGHWELDHIISLQLGGHPTAHANLWMQHYAGPCGARVKDTLEGKLKRLVCAGKLTLLQAQLEIGTDWVASYNKRIRPLSCPSPAVVP